MQVPAMTDFLKLPVSDRVAVVEYVRHGLHEEAKRRGTPLRPDLPLDDGPTKIWLERMYAALADLDCSQQGFDELNAAFESYLKSRPAAEADDLRKRLRQFAETRDTLLAVIP